MRVGFAAETDDLVAHAADKLARKSLDLIVANDVSGDVFGSDSNQVTLLWADGRREDFARMAKTAVAERVLDAVAYGIGGVDIPALAAAAEIYCTLYREHIALEESVVYPEARRLGLLSEHAQRRA